jgi:hypothetical protein
MDNLEKLATHGTQYEEKHNIICVGHHYAQTNTNNVYKTWASYKQLEDHHVHTYGYSIANGKRENNR